MKQLKMLIVALLLIGCSKRSSRQVAPASYISVIDDRTDSFLLHPIANPILALYAFPNAPDQAARFRLIIITDKLLNPVEDAYIADGPTTERRNENEEIDNREQLVHNFYDWVRHAVADFHTRYSPAGGSLKHSECFATIADELEALSKSTAAQRTLIIFSDLQENNELFSCYTEAGQDLLRSNPAKVTKLLQRRHTLPESLVGITVYFVYQPRTREEDQRFSCMMAIYKSLLHERGARTVVQATNTYYQP